MINVKNKSLDKQILIGSIICLIYFVIQWALHYYKVDTILAGMLTELITIPFLLLLVALFAGSIWLLFIKKEGNKSLLYSSLLLLFITLAVLLVM